MAGRKIIQDSDDESNCGNASPQMDPDPSLDTIIGSPGSSPQKIIEQSEQSSLSSTGAFLCWARHAMANSVRRSPE